MKDFFAGCWGIKGLIQASVGSDEIVGGGGLC